MARMLLAAAAAIAASALVPAPASADRPSHAGGGFVASPAVSGSSLCQDLARGRHGERRRIVCAPLGGWAYADGEWALYNNRGWSSDSYNDWWHDRPDRAYPRWVQEQRGGPCEPERMWWSGRGWHC